MASTRLTSYGNISVSQFVTSDVICSYVYYISVPSEEKDLKDTACIIYFSA